MFFASLQKEEISATNWVCWDNMWLIFGVDDPAKIFNWNLEKEWWMIRLTNCIALRNWVRTILIQKQI